MKTELAIKITISSFQNVLESIVPILILIAGIQENIVNEAPHLDTT